MFPQSTTMSSFTTIGRISSIFGNFQMARLETTMNAVEHNTRFMQIEAEKYFQTDSWDQQKGIVDTLDMIFNRLGDIWSTLLDTASSEASAATRAANEAGGRVAPPTSPGRQGAPGSPIVSIPYVPTSSIGGLLASAGPAGGTTAIGTGGSFGSVTFIINESASPRETARQLADTLKTLSSKFSPYGQ